MSICRQKTFWARNISGACRTVSSPMRSPSLVSRSLTPIFTCETLQWGEGQTIYLCLSKITGGTVCFFAVFRSITFDYYMEQILNEGFRQSWKNLFPWGPLAKVIFGHKYSAYDIFVLLFAN